MAVSYTTTYNLTKPEVGASEDQWGGLLNDNLDDIDNLLDGTTPVTGIDINSGTIDGTVIGGATPAAGTFTALTSNGIDDNASATSMTLDASGNVGIGTSSPSNGGVLGGKSLHVSATGETAGVRVENTTATIGGYLVTASGNNSHVLFGTGAKPLIFYTDSAERMRIDSSGNLLVNAVASKSGIARAFIEYSSASQYGFELHATSVSVPATQIAFYQNNSFVGSISSTASSTSYNTSSDYRLKTDAQPMTGASARVQALKPVNFEWISTGERVDGFLAHEAQEVVPEAVTGTKDAMRDEQYEVTPAVLDDDGNVVTEAVMGTRSVPNYQGIDQSKLVPLLTAALQEALTEIAELKARVTALEA